jgi:hypothetical protein
MEAVVDPLIALTLDPLMKADRTYRIQGVALMTRLLNKKIKIPLSILEQCIDEHGIADSVERLSFYMWVVLYA